MSTQAGARWGCEGVFEPRWGIVQIQDLELVRSHLIHTRKAAPKRIEFPFTGLIRCGECRSMVTAELKVNRHGKQYIYYHCTRSRPECQQRRHIPSAMIEATILDSFNA